MRSSPYPGDLTDRQWASASLTTASKKRLVRSCSSSRCRLWLFAFLPELKRLRQFSQEVYKLWDVKQSREVARRRWTRLKNNPKYQQVPELKEVLDWLTKDKFQKTLAFLKQPAEQRLKTNNHVERATRSTPAARSCPTLRPASADQVLAHVPEGHELRR